MPAPIIAMHSSRAGDADDRRADRTDAGPHGIRRPDRQGLQRVREQAETDRHGHDGADRGPQAGKAFRVLETDRPDDFEQACDNENDPRHDASFKNKMGRSIYLKRRWKKSEAVSNIERWPSISTS